jgi:hypothetical protein
MQVTGGAGEQMGSGGSAEGGMKATGLGGTSSKGGEKATTGGATLASGGTGGSVPEVRCVHIKASTATGIWEGYSEDFLFKPLDKYRIEVAGVDETGSLCGSVVFGDSEPLAPATDPEGAYPPGADPVELKGHGIGELWPGATYSILAGAEREPVLRFQVSPQEVMKSWCELQSVYPSSNGYGCLPGSGFGVSWDAATGATSCTATNADGTELQTTAARCYQCASECTCSESSCTSKTEHSIVFDLTLSQDENELTGVVGSTSLRLTRVP